MTSQQAELRGRMKRGLLALGAISLLAMTFQNCSLVKPAGIATSSSLVASGACQPILMDEFMKGYYPFVRDSRSCVGCHYEGGLGSGAFAAVNPEIAFDAFMTKGEDKVAQFATSAHKSPNTGQDFHNQTVPGLRTSWATAKSAYDTCVAGKGGGTGGPGGTPVITANKLLVPKTVTLATNNQTQTLTWNTATEFVDTANAFTGGSFVVTIRAIGTLGNIGYRFENPRFINTSGQPVLFRGFSYLVNQTVVDGETGLYAERYIPALTNNNSRQITTGAAFYPVGTLGQALSIQVAIGSITPSDIDFRPVTYAELTAAGGIFATNCTSCHGNSGGVTITAASLNTLVGRTGASNMTLVAARNLSDSLLYKRMDSAGAPMPPAGKLNQDQIDRVRDWILDGAPANAQAIAR